LETSFVEENIPFLVTLLLAVDVTRCC